MNKRTPSMIRLEGDHRHTTRRNGARFGDDRDHEGSKPTMPRVEKLTYHMGDKNVPNRLA